MKGYNVSSGYMGHIPGSGYRLFPTEREYIDYYREMCIVCTEMDWGEYE